MTLQPSPSEDVSHCVGPGSTSSTHWIRLSLERPPGARRCTLSSEVASGRLLCFDSESAWEMGDDGLWSRLAVTLPAVPGVRESAPPAVWMTTSGHAVIGRFTRDALVVCTLAASAHVQTYAWPHSVPEFTRAFAFEHQGPPYIHISTGDGGRTYVLGADRATEVTKGPHLSAVAYDPVRERAVGHAARRLYEFDGSGWVAAQELAFGPQGLCWHPTQRAVVTFAPDGDELRLHRLDHGRAAPVTPAVRMPKFRNMGALMVRADGAVVFFGGQDFEKAGRPTDESFFALPGKQVLSPDAHRRSPPTGRYDTLVTTADRLFHINHGTLQVSVPDGESWTGFAAMRQPPELRPLAIRNDRFVNFTACGDDVWMLDAEGAVWAASRDGEFRELGGRHAPAPAGRYSGRVGFARDATSNSLVVFGGEDRNDTWTFDFATKAWTERRPSVRPPHGVPSAVSTSNGIYALIESELWRYAEHSWSCVGKDVPGHVLLHHPDRELLLTAGWESNDKTLWQWSQRGARRLTSLPLDLQLGSVHNAGATVAVDPASDRLVALGGGSPAYALPLDRLRLDSGVLSADPVESPSQRHATPPAGWSRAASRLVKTANTVPIPSVSVRGELIALVSSDATTMPLPKGYGALAISEVPGWWDLPEHYDPGRIGGGGYYATLVPASLRVPSCVVVDGRAYLLELEPFSEVDPEHRLEVDTLPGNALDLSYGSKIGGYPTLIHDDPTEAWQGAPLRFAIQLAADLHDTGDGGQLYVWVSDDSASAYVVMQTH